MNRPVTTTSVGVVSLAGQTAPPAGTATLRGPPATPAKVAEPQMDLATALAGLPPLLPWALGVVLGIAADNALAIPPGPAAAIAALAALFMLAPQARNRWVFVPALITACACGALLHHRALRTTPADDIGQFTTAEQRLARVTGLVVDEPRISAAGFAPFAAWLPQSTRTSFILAVDGVETTTGPASASGRVRVTVKEAALQVTEGARVEAFGWLFRPGPPRNPGGFDWAGFQQRRGVHAGLVCARSECVNVIPNAEGSRPGWRTRWRGWARRLLQDERLRTGGAGLTVLDAMVLGRRAGVERNIEQAFIDTGCAHYLAVSGMHVAMLAAAVLVPARMLGLPRRRTALLVMACVAAYALLADARPPILRSAIMVFAYGIGVLLRRPGGVTGALALAAMGILAIEPAALFDLGFQLSFAAVAGIVALSPVFSTALAAGAGWARRTALREHRLSPELERIAQQHADDTGWRRAAKALRLLLAVGLSAWVSSLPIVAGGFGYVALWGWLNSLLALPLVYVVMLTGFLRMALDALIPPLGDLLDPVLDLAVAALVGLLETLAKLPGVNLSVAPPSAWFIAAYYGLLAVLAARVRGWRIRGLLPATVALLALTAGVSLLRTNTPDGVRITQLAVGRGTSTVIELPDGGVWLYDAGASGSFDPARHVILPFLRHQGIRRIDGIIISHANLDHFGGVPEVIRSLPCGPVYLAPQFERDCGEAMPCGPLLEGLHQRHHPIEQVVAGDTLQLGEDVAIEVLWPPADLPAAYDINDASLVLRLTYGGTSALLTGDIESASQYALVERGGVRADVLVLPHHGAVVPSTPAFLRAVGAEVLIRSSFVPTDPRGSLEQLIGPASLFNTADDGAIEITLDGGAVRARSLGSRPGAEPDVEQ